MEDLQRIKHILGDTEFNQLEQIKEELSDAWSKNQIFRTETEARFAVLNDAKIPTKAGKYWQSVREQMAHFNELVALSFDIRRKEIELKRAEDLIGECDGYDRELLEVDRDELLFGLAHAKRIAKDRVREIMQWSMLKKELNDGSFDDKDVNTHQRETLFKIALNKAQMATEKTGSEERLSVSGLIHMLKKESVNKELVEKLEKQALSKKG